MVKVIVFLGLLLVSGWALPEGEAVAADDDGAMKTRALPQALGQHFEHPTSFSSFGKICHPAKLNITIAGAILNVHEWPQQVYDANIFYELEVFWQENGNDKSKREELPVIRDYVIPVPDQCSIYWMRVCHKDRQSSECVCDTWIPPLPDFGEVQVLEYGVVAKSYVVAWNVSNQECVHQYKVEQSSEVVTTAISYAKLGGLKACGRYRLRLSALYRNGDRVEKSVEILPYPTTKSVIAGALRCAVEFTVQEVKVESGLDLINPADFMIPKADQNLTNAVVCTVPNLSSYLISCESMNQTTFAPISDDFSIRKFPVILKPKIDNKISTVIPSFCPALSTAISGDVTIKPPSIGPVRDLRANTDIDRSVILTWRPPIEGTKCVKEYLITWASESRVIDSSNTSYNVTNLEPCTTYEFTVNAIDHTNDKGTPESITATVRELQQLSAVTELELNEVEPRSLSVKWKPPINGTNCVESYRVVAWYNEPETGTAMEVFSNTTADQHVTFGEVIACMVYTVQVIPISISKKDGLNDIGSLKTKERTILSYHVDPIRAVTVKSRSLELSTLLHSENNNNCLLVSVRFNCTMMKEGEPVPGTQVWKDFVIPSSNTSFEGIVEPLVPYSMYQCNAQIQNIAGLSDPTPFYEFQTAEDVPESPGGVELVGQNRSINITWKAPSVKNGVVVRYRIHVRMIAPEYPLPKLCAPLEEFNETVDLRDEVNPDDAVTRSWDGVEFQHSVGNLNPYTLYTVQVAAATGAGFGAYTEPEEVVTLPDVSNLTASFRIDSIVGPELNKEYESVVSFSWELPCGLHGRLTRFVGTMHGIRDQDPLSPHALVWEVSVGENEEIQDTYGYVDNRLKPEYNYTVSISVEVGNVTERSPEAMLQFESPAGIPSINHTEEWFNVNVLDAPNPTNTARIVLGNITLTADIGSIRYMALLISERQCQLDPEPRTDFINTSGATQWPNVSDWYRANNMRCVEQYQTTPKFWNPMQRTTRAVVGPIEYVVGKESCDKGQEYCNGPLKPGTEYALIVRIFSRSGYTDSELQMFRTDSLIKVGLIVSAVIACLLLAFIGGLVVVWRKQRLLLPAQQAGRAPTEEPADIPLKSFPNQYDELFQSNREKVSKEFQAINYFSDFALQETVSFQSARENDRKNRYVNILPYDSNRVLLDSYEDEEDGDGANDYINASFIEGYKYQREYIATQGPKQETCYDFWRMVLQYEIESIVMLTQPIDHDKNKCCQYYPRFNQYNDFGDLRVKCTQELNLSLYYKRLFLVSKGNLTKAVFHYHFLDWPDHSCPASTTDLIKFSKIVRAERKSYAIPLVVHCSAGVGRTGTFIALDIILQRMQQEKKINVYDTVKRLRRQRVKMVQTLDQYTFLYQCCLEYVSKSNRKKPKTSSIEVIRRDDKSKPPYPDVILEVGEQQQQVVVGNGGKPLFNIKFPKSVNSGLGTVTSFAPSDIEGDK